MARQPERNRALRLVVAAGLLAGCGRVTSALLHIEFDSSRAVTQVQLTGRVGTNVVFGPVVRPDIAATPLTSPQTLRVLLDDSLSGGSLDVDAVALSSGAPILTGSGSANIVQGQSADLTVLINVEVDAGRDGGADGGSAADAGSCGANPACGPGQRCDAGSCVCDGMSCPAGCCSGTTCQTPSPTSCGISGTTCINCGQYADTCAATGQCKCGVNPACTSGQRCNAGNCVCDGTSCPAGCCSGTTCQVRSLTTCGVSGATCVNCGQYADTCTPTGQCNCGANPACGLGQRCNAGNCVCDSTSCPGGCCSLTTCKAPGFGSCGLNGSACIACNFIKADLCSDAGFCSCGGGAQCGFGLQCVSGSCQCTTSSCSGCCINAPPSCQNGTSTAACGTGGNLCKTCDAGQSCSGGACI